MARKSQPALLYKDISYSQLRSYCETARLGNMAAAARSLNISNSTVWKQIRSLELLFDQKLVESDGRRSELTEQGLLLAAIASPMVKEFESLQDRFLQMCGAAPKTLTVAVLPRSFIDGLMPVLDEFQKKYPEIQLKIKEVLSLQGNDLLESGEVDLVIGNRGVCPRTEDLVVEPVYEIEPMVIMPLGHPLFKQRRIMPKDLAKYPVLNRRGSYIYSDDEAGAILEAAGVFENPERRLDLSLASSVHRCVKLGYGIGLGGRVGNNPLPDPDLCQRSLKHCLPSVMCYSFSLRRVTENPTQRAFIDLLKETLK
ncbi:LysR family transcriptional regulator [Planctomicrobium sp. SH661]|uniref:LysR family transcriptional regulator n=1 Tax=Planctomicrobium sp. SH661 TaxID=3448124 RepID=UPI003F5C8383